MRRRAASCCAPRGCPNGSPTARSVSGSAEVCAGAGRAQGFAQEAGRQPRTSSTEVRPPKGEYYGFTKKVPGRGTRDILAEALPASSSKINFPKTMYWTGKGGPRFIRPIRWIVALLGEEVVPFEIAGVRSGNTDAAAIASSASARDHRHHRRTTSSSCATTASFSPPPSAARRSKRDSAAIGVKRDDALLDTLVYLTEYPDADPRHLRSAVPRAAATKC